MGRPSSQPRRRPARLSIHLQYLFNRFRMTVWSFNQCLFDSARNIVESNYATQERRYSVFIGSVESDGLGAALCGGLVRQTQVGELVQVGRREVETFQI